MFIAKSTVEKITNAMRVEEVVGEFVNLKKRGSNLTGLCPFHNEKTPSFSVSPAKGIYKCFGCGEAGNALNFIMTLENLAYPDALKWLATKYNIEIEYDQSGNYEEQKQEQTERDSVLIALEFAKKYYAETLNTSREGKNIGLNYLSERGLSAETIEKFGLGYAQDGFNNFIDYALKTGLTADALEKAGLIIAKDDGKKFDRFRARVMFPIQNLSGKVIGFGGRILKNNDKEAKYINSPETLVYNKSQVLYGIFHGKKSIVKLDNCFLTEGYMDVIAMNQAGIENVVASSGTSLTAEQARLIRRFTENVTVLYDGDAAGIKAALRGLDILLENNLNVQLVVLPDGDDPDSYIKKGGPQAFKNYVEANASDLIGFKVKLLSQNAINDPLQKINTIKDIAESIALIPDPIKRAVFIQKTSREMQIGDEVLLQEINRLKLAKRKTNNKDEVYVDYLPPQTPSITTEYSHNKSDIFQELDIVRLLIMSAYEPIGEQTVAQILIDEFGEMEWQDALLNQIFTIYQQAHEQASKVHVNQLLSNEHGGVRKLTAEILQMHPNLSENWEKKDIFIKTFDHTLEHDIYSAIDRLKLKKVIRLMEENREQLKDPNLTNSQFDEIMQLQLMLEQEKKIISAKIGSVIVK